MCDRGGRRPPWRASGPAEAWRGDKLGSMGNRREGVAGTGFRDHGGEFGFHSQHVRVPSEGETGR